ncbi:MAG TPA: MFS transporter [Candidatus Dormibacteraeota bacterium]|nr:MFS transporter [Candidatus Dormibacteraeota bacterium]
MKLPHPSRDRVLINASGFLRSLGFGFLGVVLGIYLFRTGHSSFQIGAIIAVGLAGSAAATLFVSFAADRLGRRSSLIVLSLLSVIPALVLAFSPGLAVLLLAAFFGMLNGTGTDRSPTFVLDQAILPGLAPDSSRTWNLALYNALLDGGGSLGALCSSLPLLLHDRFGSPLLSEYRTLFFAYAGLCLTVAAFYWFLSPAVEVATPLPAGRQTSPLAPGTKSVVARLTALFSLDAFGGGFLTDALVAYWFFRRFGMAERDLGLVFFAVHVLNAGSHLAAAGLAKRIGLVNTMVLTHLPSSLLLIAVPFAPSLRWALILFLCREALVEMDVPTRQSYVAAVVGASERTFAAGVTNLARNVFWAVGSAVGGFLMQAVSFSAPLVVGGGTKIFYDVLLYRSFRRLKPPEERPGTKG